MSDPLVEEVDFLVAQARMKRDLIFTKVDGFWRERVDDLVELVERAVRERDEAIHSGDLLMIRAEKAEAIVETHHKHHSAGLFGDPCAVCGAEK